jgi:hypothetical protein
MQIVHEVAWEIERGVDAPNAGIPVKTINLTGTD